MYLILHSTTPPPSLSCCHFLLCPTSSFPTPLQVIIAQSLRTVQVYCFFGVFYVTRYSVFYFLLDPFPRALCHCIPRGIVSTHFFCYFFTVVLFRGFSYLAGQSLLPRTRNNSIWQVYH